jgi:hypothetical protein
MSKEVTSGYNYRGDFSILVAAVRKAIEKMNLKTNSDKVTDYTLSFEVAEKMKWLSTNWPVKFSVEATNKNGTSTLIVRAKSTLTSFTQEFSNQAKVQEFIELVKLFAPSSKADTQTNDIERVPCPCCGEMIAKKAKMCRFCRTEF